MKATVALLVFALLLALVVTRATRVTDANAVADSAIAEAYRLERSRDSALAIIKEHADLANAELRRAYRARDAATRHVAVADTTGALADSLAAVARSAADWQRAYEMRTGEADTLRFAVGLAMEAIDHALLVAGYWQLAYMADSTRREQAENAVGSLRLALEAKRPRWRDRLGVSVGYGAQVGRVVTTGPNITLGVRVWP